MISWKTTRSVSLLLLLPIALVVPGGCRSTPEETPAPPPPAPIIEPAPPEPEPVPEVELPRPQAPLEGPRWVLSSMYGTSRIAVPPQGSVWVEFDPEGAEPTFSAETEYERISGTYNIGPRGTLTIGDVKVEPVSAGNRRFTAYHRQLLENISIVQGYYIQGDVYEESRLFLYGGLGLEEIILAEFHVMP